MSSTHADTTLTVNLAAIAQNYKLLAKKVKKAECAAVVKANAYGLGVAMVAPALAKAGCKKFFVAHVDEGIQLRELLPKAEIYVFHGVHMQQVDAFTQHRLAPVLNSLQQARIWLEEGRGAPCMVNLETGMNRLGFSTAELEQFVDDAIHKKLNIAYIMSHLACADMPGAAMNERQRNRFDGLRLRLGPIPASLANSSAIFLGKEYHYDMARPGCALYGINPTADEKNPMKPVVSLQSKILQLRNIDSDGTVGYGATCSLPKGTKIAVLPVGYADGYLRSLGNTGKCSIAGVTVPVVGRVSMDLITIDVSNVPEQKLAVGAEVEVIGAQITIDDVARRAGTIGYEILTSLGSRYQRIYTT